MKSEIFLKKQNRLLDVRATAAQIARVQRDSGEIPWCPDQKTDPWDHVEAAMGLSIGGYLDEARRAYIWMKRTQNPDGSWYSAYRHGNVADRTRDANMSAYLAVGAYHYYMITEDHDFLQRLWPSVQRALEFTLNLQSPHGEIYWAISPQGRVDRMALLTGSSSICLSLRCGLAIAARLGHQRPRWTAGLQRLENAIRNKPYRFNVTKSRYAMDWYYPILGGILVGSDARKRIGRNWKRFVVEGQGVRCVFDAPWVTTAETSELCLSLTAMGRRTHAEIVFNWIHDKKYADGSYWAGFTCPDMTVWPEDKLTWTDAVVLLAADALYELTPAHCLFQHDFWRGHGLLTGVKMSPSPEAG
jgi:hypothetical protein